MKIALTLFLFLFSTHSFSQAKYVAPGKHKKEKISPELQRSWNSFAKHISYQFKYGSENLRALIYQSLMEYGGAPEIAIIVENLPREQAHREDVLNGFARLSGYGRNALFINLTKIGMSATDAKILTDYKLQEK